MLELPEYQIKDLIIKKRYSLATAESCTGGLISHRITEVPGSSEYFLGGVTAYAYAAKEQLLGVDHETIVTHGAVSEETVMQMACGARKALEADLAVSVSGIAGPGGGMPNKPVGTVWIGLCTPTGSWAHVFYFHGNRSEIKQASATAALTAVVDYLQTGYPWMDK